MMFWTLIVVLITISEATLIPKCKKQRNCKADYCCVKSSLFHHKGICKSYKFRGEACHTDTYLHGDRYTRSCPCIAGLECVNTGRTGMLDSFLGYDGQCVYPHEVIEEPITEFPDYTFEEESTTTRKPSTTTTTRSPTTTTTTRKPTTTTTTRKPSRTTAKPPVVTTTTKPPITTTTITTRVSTTTEPEETITDEISTRHPGEGDVTESTTAASEEEYDYFECPENNEKINVTEDDLITERYDYGHYDDEDFFNHEVMPPAEMRFNY